MCRKQKKISKEGKREREKKLTLNARIIYGTVRYAHNMDGRKQYQSYIVYINHITRQKIYFHIILHILFSILFKSGKKRVKYSISY